MAGLEILEKILGISFNDSSLLEQALVHSSRINENPGLTSNERLEFFGDAVLGLIIARKLYQDFPECNEGELTKLRAVLVQRDSLTRVAKGLRLGDYLYLGKGEELSDGRNKAGNLAGALEAIIGAIFLDQGFIVTSQFILKHFEPELRKALISGEGANYKSQLQELIQAKGQKTPTYHLVAESGPEHDKVFTIEVKLDNRILARGSGKGKKKAETEAARSALKELLGNFTE